MTLGRRWEVVLRHSGGAFGGRGTEDRRFSRSSVLCPPIAPPFPAFILRNEQPWGEEQGPLRWGGETV